MLQFSQSKSELKSVYSNYQNIKDNMQLSKEVFDKTLEKYKEGISPNLELIQIHNQYLGAQSDYFKVTSELLNSINVENKIIVIKKRYWHMFIIFKINDKWQIIDNARLKDGYFNNIDEIKKIYKVNKIKKEFKNYNDFKIWFNTRANAFKFIL